MVHARLLQERERPQPRQRIGARHWLKMVVEIEQEGLAVARLDEAIGVAIKLLLQRLAFVGHRQFILGLAQVRGLDRELAGAVDKPQPDAVGLVAGDNAHPAKRGR